MPYKLMNGQNIPVKIWAPLHEVGSNALTQLRNVANLPWARYVCAMPDVHAGVGVTIGAVVALKDAVAPNIVGVDIGCGMDAFAPNYFVEELEDLKKIRFRIEELIPCGTGKAHQTTILAQNPKYKELWEQVKQTEMGKCSLERAQLQLGTLGAGNHFIEICTDKQNKIWIILHSGSRNLGKEIADTHARKTKLLSHNTHLPDKSLGVFLRGTPEFDAYWRDMQVAQNYARFNRELMMELIVKAFNDIHGDKEPPPSEPISCHHNYAAEEEHFGEKLIVARKGAIDAHSGRLGIIPGARGRKSFIVRGLGNPDSLFSASHGAGRVMGRGEAKRRFTDEDVKKSAGDVECYMGEGMRDEIAEAYKDIEVVMANQADLVEPLVELRALINIKGH